jgi:hypothetical protein
LVDDGALIMWPLIFSAIGVAYLLGLIWLIGETRARIRERRIAELHARWLAMAEQKRAWSAQAGIEVTTIHDEHRRVLWPDGRVTGVPFSD